MERSEGKALFFTAKSAPGAGVIVEIGSFAGRSTIWLAKATKLKKRGCVYAVDPHTGDPYSNTVENERKKFAYGQEQEFRKNIAEAGVQDTVVAIVNTSEEASKGFDKPLRFLFIDGIEEYDFAKTDFLSWSPMVVKGGIIAFHDVHKPGVQKVLKEYLYYSEGYKFIGRVYYTSFFRKGRGNSFLDMIFNLRFRIIFPQYQYEGKNSPNAARRLLLKVLGVLIF